METKARSGRISDIALYRYVDPRAGTGGCGLVVRLRAEPGREGFGEASVPYRLAGQGWDALQHAARTVIGSVPGQAPDLDRTASRAVRRAVRRAYEQALRDLGRPAGAGGPAVDLRALAPLVDRVAELPVSQAPVADVRPNDYPDHEAEVGSGDSPTSSLLETELLRAGLRTTRLSSRLVLAGQPGCATSIGFDRTRSNGTSLPGFAITTHKGVTRDVLAARGLPVAPGAHVAAGAGDEAYEAGMALGFPLVVKPGGGTKGIGVTTGITTGEALRAAIEQIERSPYAHTGLVVERFMSGEDYRVLATTQRVLSVVRRQRASVVGDGRHTVEELVIAANVVRRRNPNLGKLSITFHARTDDLLRRQGLTSRSVPEAGRRVWLSEVANLSQGGESYEVLDSTHESILALAVAAVRAIPGLRYAGLDVLLTDHELPATAQELTIVEVNSVPMLNMHHFPMYGPAREVAASLVAQLAHDAGMHTTPRAVGDFAVRFKASGSIPRLAYRRWLRWAAREFRVRCTEVRTGSGWVEAVAAGPPSQVGRLLRRALSGPAAAEIRQLDAEPVRPTASPTPPVPVPPAPSQPAPLQPAPLQPAPLQPAHLVADVVTRSGRPLIAEKRVSRARRRGARLLARVARQQGYVVRGLDHSVVLCERDDRVLAFRGLAGPSVSTIAALVCGDEGWLRRHLSVMDFSMAEAGDARELAELAVVGGRLVGLECQEPDRWRGEVDSWTALATAAVRALPGAAYGSVTVAIDGGRPGVAAIDPWFGQWCERDDPASAAVAAAILQFEYDQPAPAAALAAPVPRAASS